MSINDTQFGCGYLIPLRPLILDSMSGLLSCKLFVWQSTVTVLEAEVIMLL
jgi:hypothetical protein